MSDADQDQALALAEQRVGETLAERFQLDSVLGVGAMGVVYKATHLGLDKDVALKLLRHDLTADAEMVARFDREAAAASRLDHPNCVRVMDFGSTADGQRFLVMEYLEGEDLADFADHAGGKLPPFQVVELVKQILSGLRHAHQHGLVHRDIKPENIFVMGTGDNEKVKLLDFGIAKIQHGKGAAALTQARMVFGTPHFMSPEQARGATVDARSDLYAVGIVMFLLLAGKLPFDGENSVVVLRKQMRDPPPALPDEVPGSLRHFVNRLLEKKPEDRYHDATAAIAGLQRAAAPTKPALAPAAKPPPVPVPKAPAADIAPAPAPANPIPDAPAPAPKPSPAPVVAPAATTDASPRPPWLLPAVGFGAVALLAVLLATCDDDPPDTDTEQAADADEATEGLELAEVPPKPDTAAPKPKPDAENAADAEPSDPPDQSRRALDANLASIDTLLESKKYEAARITVGPLLGVYPEEPQLHWRMGQLLYATNPNKNGEAALKSYESALTLDAKLLDNEEFSSVLWRLLDNPKQRELAAKIAVELLGDEGHERLVSWVNVQNAPLSYSVRREATDHLREEGKAEQINVPLQVAMDLWQAGDADDPCAALEEALDAAEEHPDSFLAGTIAGVSVPKDDEGVACPDTQAQLDALREKYATRYAGLTPQVPTAFRKKKPSAPKSNNRRRRR